MEQAPGESGLWAGVCGELQALSLKSSLRTGVCLFGLLRLDLPSVNIEALAKMLVDPDFIAPEGRHNGNPGVLMKSSAEQWRSKEYSVSSAQGVEVSTKRLNH